MEFGVLIGIEVTEFFHIVDIRECLVVFDAQVMKRVGGLLAQAGSINQKQDSSKTLGFDQPIADTDACPRFAGTSRHRQQHFSFAVADGILNRIDGVVLVVAKRQILGGFRAQPFLGFVDVL
ncbi:hypothetical protein CA85_40030 [Allorhodopirellula solitaria]|uniref:Uncharacterized protein n=1 Tax=Allorhodopirellula solitaria TaxID=2527987 RepID=A0A5C5X2S6_9BACT|nr:hypothetical protein [Allorhodopirellula solitaria]TWT56473.1 hypothetical protein CA85_40030 [Allorhodopirellula solitaria]